MYSTETIYSITLQCIKNSHKVSTPHNTRLYACTIGIKMQYILDCLNIRTANDLLNI